MYGFMLYFLIFMIYSFIGWIVDSIVGSMEFNKLVNRGFLIGPYCPIYGFGGLLILCLSKIYHHDLFVMFISIIAICTIIEYITSYIMEKMFHARWWDYSKRKLNIDGRVCLVNSIGFGVIGLIAVYIINPFIFSYLAIIPHFLLIIITIPLLIFFTIDVVVSFNIINNIKLTTDNLRRDNTIEITKKVREMLSNKSVLSKRLMNAFPHIRLPKIKKK